MANGSKLQMGSPLQRVHADLLRRVEEEEGEKAMTRLQQRWLLDPWAPQEVGDGGKLRLQEKAAHDVAGSRSQRRSR